MTLTLYVHDGSASGPVLPGVSVTGWDGVETTFSQTTNASGYVTLTGQSGTWHFSASKSGYLGNTWEQPTTQDATRHAYLVPIAPPSVTLTLYVHDGSTSGPALSGVSVTGWDGIGTSFSQTTNGSGYVTLTGEPGTWHFSASKSGYPTRVWDESIPLSTTRHTYMSD